MPIQIGEPTPADFASPLALLGACHRRVEQFLAMLQRVAAVDGGALDETHFDALEAALRYFSQAAPLHTADEEESLFPRLRAAAGSDGEQARALMTRLQADHLLKPPLLLEVIALGNVWLEVGRLDRADAARFRDGVDSLAAIYPDHIRLEDDKLLPLAARLLTAADKLAMGREMAERRGVSPPTG